MTKVKISGNLNFTGQIDFKNKLKNELYEKNRKSVYRNFKINHFDNKETF